MQDRQPGINRQPDDLRCRWAAAITNDFSSKIEFYLEVLS